MSSLINIIMGNDKTINKNHRFTLINSEISGYSSNNDFIRITFQAQKTLRGAQVQNKTDLKFQFSMFKFGGIDTWIGKTGFTIDSKRDSKDFGTNVDYVQPKIIEVFRNHRFIDTEIVKMIERRPWNRGVHY